MNYDFCFDMEDLNGDTVTVFGYDDGVAWVEYFDCDMGVRRTHFCERGENQAVSWAYRRGYRE